MTGVEPRTSGIESGRSTNWATTTSLWFEAIQSILNLQLSLNKPLSVPFGVSNQSVDPFATIYLVP